MVHRSSSILRGTLPALLAGAAALPGAAHGATLHVTVGASGPCTPAASSCGLAAALQAAGPGDRIQLGPGSHAPDGPLADHPGSAGVTITGEPGAARPVLDLSSGTLSLLHGTGLSGVDVVAGSGRAVRLAGGLVDRTRVVVTGADTLGLELGDGAVVRNSTVVASGPDAAAISVVASGARAELRGATVLASGSGATAVLVAPAAPATNAGLRAVNSILRRTGDASELVVSGFAPGTATVVLDHVATSPAAQVVEGTGAAVTSEAQLFTAPLFIDRAAGDLRQTATSPTLDAGTADVDGDGTVDAGDAIAAGPLDLDGSPRRLGAPDIGADERELPPVVGAVHVGVRDGLAVLEATVDPRGLATSVSADLAYGEGPFAPAASAPLSVTGNEPVAVVMPLGVVPAGATRIGVRVRAANVAGSALSAPVTEALPSTPEAPTEPERGTPKPPAALPVLPPTPSGRETMTGGRTAAPPTLRLPGLLPTLVSTTAAQAGGRYAFRLRCRHSAACRGSVALTRLGATRTDDFKIPPMATRTVELTLTAAQEARIRKAGRRGARALLEVRSLDEGSTWTAVRLTSGRTR